MTGGPRSTTTGRRLAGLAGIGWFALFALGAGFLQSEPPAYDASVAQTKAFYAEYGGQYMVGDYLTGIGFVLLFLPFVAVLRTVVADRRDSALSSLILAGGVATVVVGGVATSFLDGVALARGRISDDIVAALQYIDAAAIALLGLPAALFAGSAAIAIARSGALPRWLTPIGVTASVLLVAGAAFVLEGTSGGVLWLVRFVSFIALALFVLTTSACLLLGLGTGASADASVQDREITAG